MKQAYFFSAKHLARQAGAAWTSIKRRPARLGLLALLLTVGWHPGIVLAQAPEWVTATTGSPTQTSGSSQITGTAVDASGNVFVTGQFTGQVSFGSTQLTSRGSSDVFVAKWVPGTSTWAWAQSGGGTGNDWGQGIAVSGTSVYVTGYITNTTTNSSQVLFGAVQQNGASTGNTNDLLVAKYTDNGSSATLNWTQVGGGSGEDRGQGIAVSGTSVYVTGYITNTTTNSQAVLLGGTGTTAGTVTVNGTNATSSNDLLLIKYTDNGATATLRWNQTGGGGSEDRGRGVAVSGSSVYVTGYFTNTTTNSQTMLLGGTGTTAGTVQVNGASTSPGPDLLLVKYTDNGATAALGWNQTGGGTSADMGNAVAVSGTSVYVTGNLTNSTTNTNAVLFGGTGTTAGAAPQYGVNAVTTQDMVTAKYTDNGATAALGWTQVAGANGSDQSQGIAVSGSSVYVSGYVNCNGTTLRLGGSGTTAGTTTVAAATVFTTNDWVVARYNDGGSSATVAWATVGGGAGDDQGLALAVSGTTVYSAGYVTNCTATFGAATGSPLLGTNSARAVLTKLSDLTTSGTWQTVAASANGGSSITTGTATDASGNVFVTGYFYGQVTIGSTVLSSRGFSDLFVAKWVPGTSTWAWAQGGGGYFDDQGQGIAVSGSSVYVAGFITNTTTNSSQVLIGTTQQNGANAANNSDLLVAKYTDNGASATLNWTQVGGGNSNDQGAAIAVNGTSVYVTGYITNTTTNANAVLFGGTGTTAGTVQVNGASATVSNDVVLVKYTDNGATATLRWNQVGGGTNTDQGRGVAVNGSSVYVTGYITNTTTNTNAVLLGGTGTTAGTVPVNGASTGNTNDLLVAKYTDNGATATLGWNQVGGGTNNDQGRAVAVNGSSVYVTGYFTNTTTNANAVLLGGTGTTAGTVTVNGASTTLSQDLWLVKYTDNGATATLGWNQTGGGTGTDQALGLAVSGSQVYVTGYVTNTNTNSQNVLLGGMGTTAGTVVVNGVTNSSSNELLVARYTDNGATAALDWTQAGGGTGTDQGLALALTGNTLFVGGYTTPPATFSSLTLANPAGANTLFLGRLVDLPPTITSFTPTSGPIGTTLSLTGTNLTGTTAITFTGTGNTVVTTGFTVNGAGTSITGILVPPGAQTGPLTVTTTGGVSAPSSQTFTLTPNLTFSPASGLPGTLVTLTGTGLTGATGVSFNGVLTNGMTVINSTTITAYVPVGASTGPITVSKSTGIVASSAAFTVLAPTLPPAQLAATVTPAGSLSLCVGTPTLTATFGSKAYPTGTGLNSNINSLLLQPDGKLLLGGSFSYYSTTGSLIRFVQRLNTDGSQDATFAYIGGSSSAGVQTMALQPDGKIVLGGPFGTFSGLPRVVRLNANGTRDLTFAPAGTSLNNSVYAIVVQPDGKLLLGGSFTNYNGTTANYIIRLNADGSRDASFAPTGTGLNNTVSALALQADGKILAGGAFTSYNGTAANYIIRLNADGTRDASFNPGAGFNSNVNVLTVLPNGQVLAGGFFSTYNGASAGRLARLNADGSRDPSFFLTGSGFNNTVNALARQPDGKLLVGGAFTSYNGTTTGRLARLNADGSFDATFSTGSGFNNSVFTLALQPSGQVFAGGLFTSYGPTTVDFLANLNTNGGLDVGLVPVAGATYSWSPGGSTASSVVASTAGNYQVTATYGGNTYASNVVTVTGCPTLTSFSPGSGLPGTVVTLTGTNLNTATGVSFNGVPATSFTIVNSTTITVSVPVGATTGPIAVSGVGGPVSTSAASFTVLAIAPPVPGLVATVTPAGPLNLCAGSATLTASLGTMPPFPTGTGVNTTPTALVLQPDGKILVGGAFTITQPNGAAANRITRLNADGTPDLTFAPTGTGLNNQVNTLALQPDGKILVGGFFTNYNGTTTNRVARLNADGSLDPTFAPTGTGLNGVVHRVALQADGKVVVSGFFNQYNGTTANSLIRLNPDGTRDLSFDSGLGLSESVTALLVQPDGKILVGGFFTSYNGAARNYLMRLNTDGSIDESFGAGTGLNWYVQALALQPDGKILVGGAFSTYSGTTRSYVARLNADGSLDTSFVPTGSGLNNVVNTLALQPDGKVLVGGTFTSYNGTTANRLLRLNADGSRDAAFAPTGSGLNNSVDEMALQPDGRVVLAGTFSAYNTTSIGFMARLEADGSCILTPTPVAGATYSWTPGGSTGATLAVSAAGSYQATATYGGNTYPTNVVVVKGCPTISSFSPGSGLPGTLVTLTGSSFGDATGVSFNGEPATGMTIVNGTTITVYVPVGATTGPITVSGLSGSVSSSGTPFTVLSLPPDLGAAVTPPGPLSACAGSATLTASFGVKPFLTGVGPNSTVNAIVLQPDGKVLIGGNFSTYNGATASRIARLNADGSLDATFTPTGTGLNNSVQALALQPDGKVLVTGSFTTYNGVAANRLVRLNADGTLDATFGSVGGLNGTGMALALQADGKVVVGGNFSSYNGSPANNVVRLNPDGSLDATFVTGAGISGQVNAVVVQPDGKLLLGGNFTAYNDVATTFVARLNADGTLDRSFDLGGGPSGQVLTLALLPDGKVLIGGVFYYYNTTVLNSLARLNADGSRDGSFAAFAPSTGALLSVQKVVVQPDGKLLVGGSYGNFFGTSRNYMLRLNGDGTLDASFNPTGTGFNNAVLAIAQQPDGRILAGGLFSGYNGLTGGSLVRLNADGTLHNTLTPVAGATYAWTPGGSTGATLGVSAAGSYQATATYGGNTYPTNVVQVGACPVLSSFSPTSGVPGTLVTLTGSGFGNVTGVSFNGVLTTGMTIVNSTTITAYVPVGATTGPITVGALGGGSSTSAASFTVLPIAPDVVTTVTPAGPLNLCASSPTLTASAGIRAFVNTAGASANVNAVLVQPDGKLLLGGSFGTYNGIAASRVVRLNADGTVDPTFAIAGSGLNASVLALALQPDGKVLIGGTFSAYNGGTATYVMRLNADGTRDASFNLTGTGLNNFVNALALQPDGKVVVGGNFTTYNGTTANRLLRLNADGSLDNTFVVPGMGVNNTVNALALQADGRIVVGGAFTAYHMAIARYVMRVNPDGSLDATFTPAGFGLNNTVSALALQPDGKVVLGGNFTNFSTTTASSSLNRVLRLNADGTLDNTFAPGTGFNNTVNALAVQADGKVVLGGNFTTFNGSTINRLVRLNADGTLDAGFAPASTGANNLVLAIAVQPNGLLLLGGAFTTYNGSTITRMARLAPGGGLDAGTPLAGATYAWTPGGSTGNTVTPGPGAYQATATYGGNTYPSNVVQVGSCPTLTSFSPGSGVPGTLVTLTGSGFETITGVSFNGVLSNAFSIVNGTTITAYVPVGATTGPITVTSVGGGSSTSATAFTVLSIAPDLAVSVTPAGPLNACTSPTLTAATATKPLLTNTGTDNTVQALALLPNGKFFMGGFFTAHNGAAASRLLRLNADGTRDATFATTGSGLNGQVNAVAVQPDGKVLLGGNFTTYNGTAASYLIRLNADGTRDATFTAPGTGLNNLVNALLLQPDGKLLVGGQFTAYGSTPAYRLLRLNADGSLDNTFALTGLGLNNLVWTLTLQPDGKILVGGPFNGYNGTTTNRILRLHTDGRLDPTFAPTGGGLNSNVNAIAVQPDGKMVVGGLFTQYNGTTANRIIRLNADGTLDASFAPTGTGLNNNVNALTLQPDGKVLATGTFTSYNGATANFLIRLNADGSRDAAFVMPGSGLNGLGNALVLQPDGKVLIGGGFTAYNGAAASRLLRLNADGSRDAATAVTATYSWTPGGSTGATLVASSAAGGTYQATATVNGTAYLSNQVVVTPCPVITGFTPASGPVGTVVTINGSNLGGATSITFSGSAGNVVSSGFTVNGAGTQITGIVVPAGAVTGSIRVTTPSGTSAPSSPTFTVTPSLSNLVLSAGSLSPAFAPGTLSYTMSVPSTTTSTTVTPTNAQVPGNTITVNGTPVTSGTASGSTALNAGTTTITVVVNPVGPGTPVTYTVTITRCVVTALTQSATVLLNASGTATLAAAAVDNGSSSPCGAVTLSVSPSTFTCANLGANTVTLTATDGLGNSASQTATVTVQDAIAPAFACGTGTAASPFTSLNCALSVATGTYWFYINSSLFQGYVDGTTDGGGWVEILNYVHAGGTNPALNVRTNSLPVQTSAALGANESASATAWGHAAPSLVSALNPQEVRFYAQTSAHGRVIHFKTSHAGTLAYFKTGTGSMSGIASSYTALPGHSANLPGAASSFFTNQGSVAMTEFPFWVSSTYHWGVRGLGNRWEVDDYPNNEANSTIHRVFVRGSAAPTPALPVFVNNAAGQCGATVSFSHSVSDNCGGATVSYSPASGSFFPTGTSTVTATATDPSSNQTTTTFQVVVSDTEQPVALAQSLSVSVGVNGRAYVSPAAVDNGSTDNCAITNLALSASTFGACGASSALVFDGSNDYVSVPHSAAYNVTNAITLEAWIKTSFSGEQYISTKTENSWYLAVNGGGTGAGKVTFWLNGISNGSGGWLAGATTVSDGNWHHVAATYDGAALRIYVDGVLDASRVVSGTIAAGSSPVLIGARPSQPWNGSLDEVRIWSVARTPAEINLYKDKSLQGSTAGLLAYFDFNDGAGSATVQNRGGVGTAGTLTNMTTATAFAGPGMVPALGLGSQAVTLTMSDAAGNVSTATATVNVSVPVLTSVTWTGNFDTNWTDCRNWSYGTLPSATISAMVPAGMPRYPSLTAGTYPANDVTVVAGASLTLGSTATLQVNGNWANNGTATLAGTVAFVGSAASQTVGGGSATAFSTVDVNKASGTVQLTRDMAVNTALTVSSGLLTTTSAYKVVLGNSAAISESETAYVVGNVETTRLVNTAGTSVSFGGLGLSLQPAAGSTVLPGSTRVVRTTGTTLTGVGTSQSIQRYYDIQAAVNTGLNVNLTFGYFDHERNGIAETDLALFKSGAGLGGQWTPMRYVTRDAAANTVYRPAVSSFSIWTLGSESVPLPVELLAFTAKKQGPVVQLDWSTASERNSAYFDVERSGNGRDFVAIGQVAAQGTSASPTAYALTDARYPGETNTLYYRLKQVDVDGRFTYSPVRTVQLGKALAQLSVYPNPATADATVIGAAAGAAVQVYDALGRLLVQAKADAEGTARLVLPAGTASGVYLVKAGTLTTRLTVE